MSSLSYHLCVVYPLNNKSLVCDLLGGGGRGGWGMLKCTVDHILQEFYTLYLTRFKTFKIAHRPKQKSPVKTTLMDWCL